MLNEVEFTKEQNEIFNDISSFSEKWFTKEYNEYNKRKLQMILELTEEQVDLLAKLEKTGSIVTKAKVDDEESIIEKEDDCKNYDEEQDEVEPVEETTLECSACSVILSIDQVILNTLAQEDKLAISSVDNIHKLIEIRDMYMRY